MGLSSLTSTQRAAEKVTFYSRLGSFKASETGTNRGDSRHCNYVPVYRFRDNDSLVSFSPLLPIPVSFEALARGFPET